MEVIVATEYVAVDIFMTGIRTVFGPSIVKINYTLPLQTLYSIMSQSLRVPNPAETYFREHDGAFKI